MTFNIKMYLLKLFAASSGHTTATGAGLGFSGHRARICFLLALLLARIGLKEMTTRNVRVGLTLAVLLSVLTSCCCYEVAMVNN